MKKLLNLCTLFMAIIGLNAAIWVVYILAYSQLVGEFPKISRMESSGNATVLTENSADTPSFIATNTYSDNELLADNSEQMQNIVTIPDTIENTYDAVKQQRFEELQTQKERLSQAQQQYSAQESNIQNNFVSNTDTQSTYMPTQDSQKASAVTENTQEIPVSATNVSRVTADSNNVAETSVSIPGNTVNSQTDSVTYTATPEQNTVNNNYAADTSIQNTDNQNITENNNINTYSTPESQISVPDTGMVWLSATGDKYHRIDHCGRMDPTRARQVSLEYAQSQKIEPCSKCFG